MTDGLRKSHLRKAPQVGLSEVGLPEGNLFVTQPLPVVPTKDRKTIFSIENPSDFCSLFDSFIK